MRIKNKSLDLEGEVRLGEIGDLHLTDTVTDYVTGTDHLTTLSLSFPVHYTKLTLPACLLHRELVSTQTLASERSEY